MMTVRQHFHSTGAGMSFYNNWFAEPKTNCYTNFRVRQAVGRELTMNRKKRGD